MDNHDEQATHYQQLNLLLAYLQLHDYRFTTVSPASHERVNSRSENAISNDLIGIFGWNRTFEKHKIDATLFALMQSANIVIEDENGCKSLLRVSSLNNHLFLHSAYPTVANSAVFFGPDTYRFSHAIHQFLISATHPVYRAVDIGTGSGAGAFLLAQALPESEIIAVDINQEALNLASVNLDAKGIQNVVLVQSNLLNNVEGHFDLIIANPPYLLDEAERAYRHGGGELGAGLSLDIIDAAIERLNINGTLLLYTGVAIVNGHDAFFAEASVRLDFAGFTYQYREIDPDVFGEELDSEAYAYSDRIAAVVLTARKNA